MLKHYDDVYRITFTSPVWVYPGEAGWRFMSVPKNESQKLKELFGGVARGFGSLKVRAQIGGTEWQTSIFPDSKQGVYLLPVKASVRKAENIQDEDMVQCVVLLLDV